MAAEESLDGGGGVCLRGWRRRLAGGGVARSSVEVGGLARWPKAASRGRRQRARLGGMEQQQRCSAWWHNTRNTMIVEEIGIILCLVAI